MVLSARRWPHVRASCATASPEEHSAAATKMACLIPHSCEVAPSYAAPGPVGSSRPSAAERYHTGWRTAGNDRRTGEEGHDLDQDGPDVGGRRRAEARNRGPAGPLSDGV